MLVIGNGESRSNIDLSKISRPKIGCNAIYRDIFVDHLVCVDLKMMNEVKDNHHKIYTRKDWVSRYKDHTNIFAVPDLPYNGIQRWDEPWHWGSGTYAILLGATITKISRVDLIGFDLYSKNGFVNNIYKDSKNYANSFKRAVDPRYWILQASKIFECFENIEFVIHQTDTWELPDSWKKSNVTVDKISNILYYKV